MTVTYAARLRLLSCAVAQAYKETIDIDCPDPAALPGHLYQRAVTHYTNLGHNLTTGEIAVSVQIVALG